MSRDVDAVRARLDRLAATAQVLGDILADLHSLGYEAARSGTEAVSGGTPSDVGDTGQPVARDLWRQLDATVRVADRDLAAVKASIMNHLSAGPSPPATRGSLISKAEFRRLRQRQADRRSAGEYTPARHLPQPRYPGGKT